MVESYKTTPFWLLLYFIASLGICFQHLVLSSLLFLPLSNIDSLPPHVIFSNVNFSPMVNVTATPATSFPVNTSHLLLSPLKPPPCLTSLSFTKPLPLLSVSLPPTLPQRCGTITRVSTTPVEYAPDSGFQDEITRLKGLKSRLFAAKNVDERMRVLKGDSRVEKYLNTGKEDVLAAAGLGVEDLVLIRSLVAAGQGHVVGVDEEEVEKEEFARSSVKEALYALVEMIERFEVKEKRKVNYGCRLREEEVVELRKLVQCLREVEKFYDCIGGIIGYQIAVLELLADSTREKQTMNWSQHLQKTMDCQFLEIHTPRGLDLSKNTEYASQAALWGIEGLPDLGEIYPLGGSADRLGLVDPDTGECLPAAMLPYCGRTLLEGLIRDVQAREFLYFKLYGRQCITPIAIMTSSAKNNHERITALCESLGWFGRGQSSFQLFEQPLVPAVSAEDGQWLVSKSFAPVCKPGGHGVIWKLAHDKGIFQWFYNHGRKGATVRQVSNVVAATDLTLMALAGIGLHHGKKLGFASCKRTAGATEGINALIEKKNLDGLWAYGLSCIEYTEFEKLGIPSEPMSSNSFQAQFPANTNILYVDLPSVELIASSNNEKCLPGMVLNTKKPVVYADYFGTSHSVPGGRLECTMQNIADNFLNTYSSRCYQSVEEELDTFIVYNERRRVTSSAKKKRKFTDNTMHQTPDGSLLDILRNARDILSHCNIEVPQIESNDKYADSGPPFLILLHPALGPLWEVTRQKFEGGSISYGSELQIEVAEFLWRNVELDGSMIVLADNVTGSMRIDENGEQILQYGHRCGRCRLHNVKVFNRGIDWSSGDNLHWRHDVKRVEVCKIVLHGNAEFEASDVTLQGNHMYEVPDGYKMKITSGNSGVDVQLNPLETMAMDSGSWFWNYKINGNHVQLELVEL